ncbi:hypothetical protein KI387_001459, partial [Taxus chinensis]
ALESESAPPPSQPLLPPHSPSTSATMASIFSGLSPLSAGTQVITSTPQPVPLFAASTTMLAAIPPSIVESSPLESRIPVTTTLTISSDTDTMATRENSEEEE